MPNKKTLISENTYSAEVKLDQENKITELFHEAYQKVAAFEGGYSNHPHDKGGETFCGISRVSFPSWSGWQLVDGYAAKQDAAKNAQLKSMVKSFYKQSFWDYFDLDSIACGLNLKGTANHALAYEIYEQAINLGVGRATRNFQKVANTLNYKHKFGEDLAVDGAFGKAAKIRLEQMIKAGAQTCLALTNGLNALQGAQYIDIATKDASQRVFTLGWLSKRA